MTYKPIAGGHSQGINAHPGWNVGKWATLLGDGVSKQYYSDTREPIVTLVPSVSTLILFLEIPVWRPLYAYFLSMSEECGAVCIVGS